MTLKEAIQKANGENNYLLAGRLSDLLWFKYGLNYAEQVKLWKKCGVSAQRFEELMWYADHAY